MSQKATVLRPLYGPVLITTPDGATDKRWFRDATGRPQLPIRRTLNPRAFEWAASREGLRAVTDALAGRFGEVDLFMEYSLRQSCGAHCGAAINPHCTCSCLGIQHAGTSALNQLPIHSVDYQGLTATALRRITPGA